MAVRRFRPRLHWPHRAVALRRGSRVRPPGPALAPDRAIRSGCPTRRTLRTLLAPEAGLTRFEGRDEERADLLRWCTEGRARRCGCSSGPRRGQDAPRRRTGSCTPGGVGWQASPGRARGSDRPRCGRMQAAGADHRRRRGHRARRRHRRPVRPRRRRAGSGAGAAGGAQRGGDRRTRRPCQRHHRPPRQWHHRLPGRRPRRPGVHDPAGRGTDDDRRRCSPKPCAPSAASPTKRRCRRGPSQAGARSARTANRSASPWPGRRSPSSPTTRPPSAAHRRSPRADRGAARATSSIVGRRRRPIPAGASTASPPTPRRRRCWRCCCTGRTASTTSSPPSARWTASGSRATSTCTTSRRGRGTCTPGRSAGAGWTRSRSCCGGALYDAAVDRHRSLLLAALDRDPTGYLRITRAAAGHPRLAACWRPAGRGRAGSGGRGRGRRRAARSVLLDPLVAALAVCAPSAVDVERLYPSTVAPTWAPVRIALRRAAVRHRRAVADDPTGSTGNLRPLLPTAPRPSSPVTSRPTSAMPGGR